MEYLDQQKIQNSKEMVEVRRSSNTHVHGKGSKIEEFEDFRGNKAFPDYSKRTNSPANQIK